MRSRSRPTPTSATCSPQLPHRGDARVLVITGEGRGFCSGGDVEEIIGELVKLEAAELLEFTRMTGAVVKALRECRCR